MSRKKTNVPVYISNLLIVDIAEEGKGVAKHDELVIFVDKAVPGDVVNVRLTKKKKNFAEAIVESILVKSEERVDPFCSHFGTCGGCKWQHMSYAAQLKYKQRSVASALERIGQIDVSAMEPILASKTDKYYRNKLEFTFSNKRWLQTIDKDVSERDESFDMNALGFHVPLRFDKILDIDHCYLQADPSNNIRNAVRKFASISKISFYDLRNHEGALRNLIIRTSSTGEVMVVVIFAYPQEGQVDSLMAFLKAEFAHITSLMYVINEKKNDTIFDQEVIQFAGKDFIFEQMELENGTIVRFKIGAKSFYQTNSAQALELYKITRDFAGFKGNEKVYDLYTGAGTIANFIARDVKEVIGVEYVPTAIEDAKYNAELNEITNTKFFAGDMKDVLNSDFVVEHGKPDVIITDPPRAGMHQDVVNRLLEIEAEKIVYVSCNAATQARDIAWLAEKYDVERMRPVDMFPHTQHVENVVLLKLKK
ncbi:23S rRNA (uracil1939-C5)-methyltransferase [Pedobacter sp. UYEF25]